MRSLIFALVLLVPSVGLAQVRFDVSLREGRVQRFTPRMLRFDGSALYLWRTTNGVVERIASDGSVEADTSLRFSTQRIACNASVCAGVENSTTVGLVAREGSRVGTVTIDRAGAFDVSGLVRAGSELVAYTVVVGAEESQVNLYRLPAGTATLSPTVTATVPGTWVAPACDGTRCVIAYASATSVGFVPVEDFVVGSPVTLPSTTVPGPFVGAALGGGRVVVTLGDTRSGLALWRSAFDGSDAELVATASGSSPANHSGCTSSGECFVIGVGGDVVHVPPAGPLTSFASDARVLACTTTACWTDAAIYSVAAGVATEEVPSFGDAVTQNHPSLATRDGSVLVAFTDDLTETDELWVGTLSNEGALGPLTSLGPAGREPLGLAAHAGGYYAVVQFDTALLGNTQATRLAADGTRLEASFATLGTSTNSDVVATPTHLLTLMGGTSITTRRMSTVGVAEGDAPVPVRAVSAPDVAVARGGDAYLAVWSELRDGRGREVYGVRLDATGAAVGAPFAIGVGDGNQRSPRVVWLGDVFVVAWISPVDAGTAIRGARVTPAGEVLDVTGIELWPAGPSVDGRGYAVVADGPEVGVVRLLRENRMVGDELVSFETVSARRLTATGVLREERLVGESSTGTIGSLDAVRVGPGNWVIVARHSAGSTFEVRAIGFDWGGVPGATCGDATECASGVCIDGVCCDAACDGACATCRAADGAVTDGACAPRAVGVECRGASDACDLAESCDGESLACPMDLRMAMCGEDAGVPDAGASDAGAPSDAGTSSDAGAPSDAGTSSDDASLDLDAGVGDVDAGGGGCSAAGHVGALPGWIVAAMLMRRRRRAR
jgi:hypothetical protein